jgi:hypothetical protein
VYTERVRHAANPAGTVLSRVQSYAQSTVDVSSVMVIIQPALPPSPPSTGSGGSVGSPPAGSGAGAAQPAGSKGQLTRNWAQQQSPVPPEGTASQKVGLTDVHSSQQKSKLQYWLMGQSEWQPQSPIWALRRCPATAVCTPGVNDDDDDATANAGGADSASRLLAKPASTTSIAAAAAAAAARQWPPPDGLAAPSAAGTPSSPSKGARRPAGHRSPAAILEFAIRHSSHSSHGAEFSSSEPSSSFSFSFDSHSACCMGLRAAVQQATTSDFL